jgi:hypothetical protein
MRIVLARVLTVIGVLLVVVSLLANFVKREALDPDQFRETSEALIADPAIQAEVANAMVETLYSSVDVSAALQQRLPPDLQSLAGPIAGMTREVADRAAGELLQRPRVQATWVNITSAAHDQFINVLEGDTRALETTDGKVVLDIRPLVIDLGTRYQFVDDLAAKIPAEQARITIMESDQLGLAQDITQILKVVANWIWVLAILAWAGAVWLARGRRRLELRAIALGFVIVGLAVVAIRGAAGNYIVDNLVATDSVKPAVTSAWSIITESLAASGWTAFIVGVLALVGLWLAGPGRRATGLREELAPYLRRADVSYAVLLVLFLLFVWWSPIVQLLNVAIIGVLALIGLEVLRRRTAREFPNAVAPDDLWDSVRTRFR